MENCKTFRKAIGPELATDRGEGEIDSVHKENYSIDSCWNLSRLVNDNLFGKTRLVYVERLFERTSVFVSYESL